MTAFSKFLKAQAATRPFGDPVGDVARLIVMDRRRGLPHSPADLLTRFWHPGSEAGDFLKAHLTVRAFAAAQLAALAEAVR